MLNSSDLEDSISRIRRDLLRKGEHHEIVALNSRLDSLECSMREISAKIDGLFDRVQRMEEDRE